MFGQARSGRDDGDVIDGKSILEAFIASLTPVSFEIDPPATPTGEWWIDLEFETYSTNVSWRSDRGFGIFTSGEDAYGERPNELFREPDLAARRIMQLATRANEQTSDLRLSDVRKLFDKSQVAMADLLQKDQGFISRLERQDDALLSTIGNYVHALGGEIQLFVRFAGFEAPVSLPHRVLPLKLRRSGRAEVATTPKSRRGRRVSVSNLT